ncbi:hypothetical protein SAMN06265173_10516 [Thalassovita litoralis]|jgi:hypothetical protein|uniref:AtuA-like ferredoxin-fold domain-containing protein n=1 Tax=Thalassovita litoralis TaxID=1010611 RepID=A0A521C0J9_9RHOB|nr:hypothetical protein [Thalassovita litoralis]SMO52885.1 hypothetical protein SAMN06265173_10516 [Thalassovita litoralis]
MKLHELAHARTGDKGDISNISVIAYRAEDWPLLQERVTEARVAAYLGHADPAVVTRYVLPQLQAMNFVIRGALTGGVTRSLALDAHGKCLASVLLEMEV